MTHIYDGPTALCGFPRPYKIDCPDCLLASSEPADEESGLDIARELVTLRLLDDPGDYADRIREVSRSDRPTVEGLLLALVEGLAATWDSADDFSAHVIAALAEDGDA